mgnify:FL=1
MAANGSEPMIPKDDEEVSWFNVTKRSSVDASKSVLNGRTEVAKKLNIVHYFGILFCIGIAGCLVAANIYAILD